LSKKTQYLVTKLYIYKKIAKYIAGCIACKCIYVHITSFAYKLLLVLKIYGNVNYRLAVEL